MSGMESADFHLDPSKQGDAVLDRLRKTQGSIEDVSVDLKNELERDPSNPELQRQARLLIERADELREMLENTQTKH